MSCLYFYEDVLQRYLRDVAENIILNNDDKTKPFPVYDNRADYDNDTTSPFKGLLVWTAQRYYAGFDSNTNNEVYDNSIDFFIVPEIGRATIVRNYEYKQLISYTFDTNTSLDKDPTTAYQTRFINWFINKHKVLFEQTPYRLDNVANVQAIINTINISKPIYNPTNTIYVRRVVLVELKYCNCS